MKSISPVLRAGLQQSNEQPANPSSPVRAGVLLSAAISVGLMMTLGSTIVHAAQDPPTELERLAAEAIRLQAEGKIDEAVAAADKVLALTRESKGDPADVAVALARLAVLQEKRFDFELALKYRTEARDILKKLFVKNDNLEKAEVNRPRLVVQTGHSDVLTAVGFSPDGKRVVTASGDGTARIWDADAGKEILQLTDHTARLWAASYSSDGKRIVTGSQDNTARIWDAEPGKELRQFPGHVGFVFAAAFSADGKRIVTGGGDATVRIWDADTGKDLQQFAGHTLGIVAISFSPDGKRVVTGSHDRTARIWDAETGKELQQLAGHTKGVVAVGFSPDGKRIVTGSHDRTARIWDAETGMEIRQITGHGGVLVSTAGFSPDGKWIVTGGANGMARIWEAESGKEIQPFRGHEGAVTAAAFSRDGKRIVTASFDKSARIWNVETGKEIRKLAGYAGAVGAATFSPNGKRIVTSSWDMTTGIWDVASGTKIRQFIAHNSFVVAAAYSPDGKRIVTGSWDKTAGIWDGESGVEIRRLTGHTNWINSASFSPDGKRIVTGSHDKTVRIWDAATGEEIQKLNGHTFVVMASAFSPDGKKIVTGGWDRTARIWDAETGKEIRQLAGVAAEVYAVAFSPDGKKIVTASQDMLAQIWDADTGKEIRRFARHWDKVLTVGFSPDGKRIVTGSQDKTARIWDVETGKEIQQLAGHTGYVFAAGFSPDGKRVITGSGDGTTRIWDTNTGKQLCLLVGFTNGGWAVADLEGRYDASNGGDVEGLHWVVNLEPVALNQFKERYYDPGLFAKHMGFNTESFRQVAKLKEAKLYPKVEISEVTKTNPKLTIQLTNQGGGIGRVLVNLNGKEITADARPQGTDPNSPTLKIELDLRGDPRLNAGGKNIIEVQAFNAEGYLRSRGLERDFVSEEKKVEEPPHLWAMVAGVSKYAGTNLELRYAAKDAEDFATGLRLGAHGLFGVTQVHLNLFTTSQTGPENQPTRANLVKALEAMQKSKPGDLVVIYLAGHGVNHGGQESDFFYLTRDALSAELKDPEVRQQTSISSAELTELLKKIPAQKQVLILDTCASGKALEKLTAKRDIPGSQVRALERVKDRTGLHILAGCAADAVSYEASRYGQGILTYSLLLGMRGAKLREGEYVDIVDLFSFAADKVPELARDIGGVQRPTIASPRGASFDIGRLTAADRAKVPLQAVKPVLLRSSFQLEKPARDSLGLSKLINAKLQEASASMRGAKLVFVDAEEFPDGVQASGRYKIDGDKATVSVSLFVGEKELASFVIDGPAGKPDELAGKIVSEIEKKLASDGK